MAGLYASFRQLTIAVPSATNNPNRSNSIYNKRSILLGFVQPYYFNVRLPLRPLLSIPIPARLRLPPPGLHAIHLDRSESVASIGFLSS